MRTVSHVSSQFPWCAIWRDTNGDILEVVLPSYNHVVFLSSETELCPSLYRNLGRRDQVFNDHVKAYKWLNSITQETGRLKHGTNDLMALGHKRRVCFV